MTSPGHRHTLEQHVAVAMPCILLSSFFSCRRPRACDVPRLPRPWGGFFHLTTQALPSCKSSPCCRFRSILPRRCCRPASMATPCTSRQMLRFSRCGTLPHHSVLLISTPAMSIARYERSACSARFQYSRLTESSSLSLHQPESRGRNRVLGTCVGAAGGTAVSPQWRRPDGDRSSAAAVASVGAAVMRCSSCSSAGDAVRCNGRRLTGVRMSLRCHL